jgi:hypothetical protein
MGDNGFADGGCRKGGGRDENRIEAQLYACKLGIYPVVRRTWREALT